MDDRVQPPSLVRIVKHDIANRAPVQGEAIRLEDPVRPEMRNDEGVAGRPWLDHFASEQVGIDEWEVVLGGEEGGDGRFTGGDAPGEADD